MFFSLEEGVVVTCRTVTWHVLSSYRLRRCALGPCLGCNGFALQKVSQLFLIYDTITVLSSCMRQYHLLSALFGAIVRMTNHPECLLSLATGLIYLSITRQKARSPLSDIVKHTALRSGACFLFLCNRTTSNGIIKVSQHSTIIPSKNFAETQSKIKRDYPVEDKLRTAVR